MNAIVTKINKQRFTFEMSNTLTNAKRRAAAAQKARLQKRLSELANSAAEAWAKELDELCSSLQNTPASFDRGGWRALQEYKMSEEYNTWHTLDDRLDYGALLRGIHNIQERGGDSAAEKRFCDAVCDRFGHARLDFSN